MELDKIVARREYSVRSDSTGGVSVWYYPKNGTPSPLVFKGVGPIPMYIPTQKVHEDDYVFEEEDYEALGTVIDDFYNQNANYENGEPLRDHAIEMLLSSFVEDSSVLVNDVVKEKVENIPDEVVDRVDTRATEGVQSTNSVGRFEDVVCYVDEINSDYIVSLWGVSMDGDEYCIYYDCLEDYILPVTHEPTEGREVMSDEFYDVLLSTLVHLRVTRHAHDGTIFMDEDKLSDAEYGGLLGLLMIFEDFLENNREATSAISMLIDLVSRKKEDKIEEEGLDTLFSS